MGRPQKKKNKRKGNRNHQAHNNGHHSRHEEPAEEEPAVSFDPDPPVAGDGDSDGGSESDDASLIFDTVRVPEVALNCALQAIQLGAVGMIPPKMLPPAPPPRRPAPVVPTTEEESHLSLVRYLSRKPGRRSRIRKGVPLNNIEPLVSYNRKMARVAPRSTIRTPTAQLNREAAAVLCPCNQVEESQIKSIRAVQLFMRSPRFFTLMQFTTAFAARLHAYRLMRECQQLEAPPPPAKAEGPQANQEWPQGDAPIVNGEHKKETEEQLNGESSGAQSNGTLEETAEDDATRAELANGAQKTKELSKNGTVSDDDDASCDPKGEAN